MGEPLARHDVYEQGARADLQQTIPFVHANWNSSEKYMREVIHESIYKVVEKRKWKMRNGETRRGIGKEKNVERRKEVHQRRNIFLGNEWGLSSIPKVEIRAARFARVSEIFHEKRNREHAAIFSPSPLLPFLRLYFIPTVCTFYQPLVFISVPVEACKNHIYTDVSISPFRRKR